MLGQLIDQTFRRERARLLAGLVRVTRDLDLAEEALQEACLEATQAWASTGLPDNPGAWLNVVARRRAIDLLRRARREAPLDDIDSDPEVSAPDAAPESPSGLDTPDHRLGLLFACCRASLPERARAALALRSFLGLGTREIAKAFLEPEATTAQRIVRAKRSLQESEEAFEVPAEEDRTAAFGTVLGTLYLLFNEGYLATEGQALVRAHLCDDAISLAMTLVELAPDHAEARGLLSLMLFHGSRRAARIGEGGEMLTLEEQDRSAWDRSMIDRGLQVLAAALSLRAPGPYQIQAAISSLHCLAASPEQTDWPQIAALYGRLLQYQPTPVVELNAAVALAMAKDVESGLRWVNDIERRKAIRDYYLLAAVKADLLRRAGFPSQANRYFRRARKLCKNEPEKRYLDRRIRETDHARGAAPSTKER